MCTSNICLNIDYLDVCCKSLRLNLLKDLQQQQIFKCSELECAVIFEPRNNSNSATNFILDCKNSAILYPFNGYILAGFLSQNQDQESGYYQFRFDDEAFYNFNMISNHTFFNLMVKILELLGLQLYHVTRVDFAFDFVGSQKILCCKYTAVDFIKRLIDGSIYRVSNGAARANTKAVFNKNEQTKVVVRKAVPLSYYFEGGAPATILYNKIEEFKSKSFKSFILRYWLNFGFIEKETELPEIWRFEMRYSYKKNKQIAQQIFYILTENYKNSEFLQVLVNDIKKRFIFAESKSSKGAMTRTTQILDLCNNTLNICNLTYYKLSEKAESRPLNESDLNKNFVFSRAVYCWLNKIALDKNLLSRYADNGDKILLKAAEIIKKACYYRDVQEVKEAYERERVTFEHFMSENYLGFDDLTDAQKLKAVAEFELKRKQQKFKFYKALPR